MRVARYTVKFVVFSLLIRGAIDAVTFPLSFFFFASLSYAKIKNEKYSVQWLSKPNSGEDYFLLLPY